MSERTDPVVGRIYQDGERDNLRLQPPWSAMRSAVHQRFQDALAAEVFDERVSQAVRALGRVLDLHKPWEFWHQTFLPSYIGDEFLGVGCRCCGLKSQSNPYGEDCWTVRTIAEAMGVPT